MKALNVRLVTSAFDVSNDFFNSPVRLVNLGSYEFYDLQRRSMIQMSVLSKPAQRLLSRFNVQRSDSSTLQRFNFF